MTTIGASPNDAGHPIAKWVVGGLAIGGALLWAKYQTDQVNRLYTKSGLSHESFVESLREGARALPSRASASLRGLANRINPPREIAVRTDLSPRKGI
jgi:hypothetical protein